VDKYKQGDVIKWGRKVIKMRIIATTVNLANGEVEQNYTFHYGSKRAQAWLMRHLLWCANNGRGLALEQAKQEPEKS
jgi:hypothetical protein